ncbi:MAG: MATE family efflux transporter [Pseudomonadota bacterium]
MAEAAAEVTHRRVLRIAVPVVLSNVTIPLLGIVDTGVVGQMGQAAPIAAVGLGAVIITSLYWFFGFLRMGTTGLAGQALGAGDGREADAVLIRALMIGVGAGVLLMLLQAPLLWLGLALAPASAEVEEMATAYLRIRIYGAPAAIAIYGVTGWLIAQERTTAVLVLQLWMNGLNIALDLWFVLGLGWGVEGVALATFLAEWSGLALALMFCGGVLKRGVWRSRAALFDPEKLARLLAVSTDITIRSVLLMAAFTSFLFLGARFGDVTLASNQVLLQFIYLASYGLDGFAYAVEALVAQTLGARRRAALRRSVVICAQWCAVIAVGVTGAYAVFGGAIIDLMTTAPDVREVARVYLPWVVVMPVLSAGSFLMDGVFIGATRTRDMRNMMILSFAAYAGCAAVLVPLLENHGLWAAVAVFFVVRFVTLLARYPRVEADAMPPAEVLLAKGSGGSR